LRARLKDCPGLRLQEEPPRTRSSFLYVRARADDPPSLRRWLLRAGIDTKPDDMRNCAALAVFGEQPHCPVAETLGEQCIELPCSPFYSRRQMEKIASRLAWALKG
jgi:dTDP-4-amino-4,6-dideoxygalactose transaminase